jgi:hypothetical protein
MDRADSSRGARGDDGPNDDGLGEIACDGAHMYIICTPPQQELVIRIRFIFIP